MEFFPAMVLAAAESLVGEASAAGLTVGCAESCTGGLVSAAITSIAGSSAVLRGGIVSYALAIKHDVLGVSQDILDDPRLGAVSAPCAEQMARGARQVLKCDVAVSVTGIAGPGGAEPDKPVGTVFFGLSTARGTHAALYAFSGSRDEVRCQAVETALSLLREGLLET